MNFNSDAKPSWEPIDDLSRPAGFNAPAKIQSQRSNSNFKENSVGIFKVAAEIMRDPLLMLQLTDRVYELMLEDLRNQRERSNNYRGLLL